MREHLDMISLGASPNLSAGLLVAGLVPTLLMDFFSTQTIVTIYYLLLIPPAAYHLYAWGVKLWQKIKNRKQ